LSRNEVLFSPTLPPSFTRVLKIPILTTLQSLTLEGYWISVAFISQKEMAELAKKYKGKRGPTDILSFPPPSSSPPFLWRGKVFLGELLLAPGYIIPFCQRLKLELDAQATRIMIHGTLHLAGYDHDTNDRLKRMRGKENQILALIPPRIQKRIADLFLHLADLCERGESSKASPSGTSGANTPPKHPQAKRGRHP